MSIESAIQEFQNTPNQYAIAQMSKIQKIKILKMAEQMVMMCTEHTPPNVKYSKINGRIASVSMEINNVIKEIKNS